MKTKINNLIGLACVLCLMSCSSDDSTSSNSKAEGSWMLTSLSVETAFDFDNDGTASRNLFEETPCYDGDFVTFNTDGSARVVNGLAYISAEVNSPTDYTYVYQCLSGVDVETTWTQDGNVVTIENGTRDFVGTISGNTLTVNISDLFQMQLYNGTDYYAVEEDVILVYVKG